MERSPVDHFGARILVIDDDAMSLALTRAVLEQAGYRAIATTDDAERGLATCHEQAIDLVILDVVMPVMSGLQVLARLREPGIERAPSVIVITGSDEGAVRRSVLDLGASDYVRKPFEPHELIARVRNALDLRLLNRLLVTANDELLTQVVERERKLEQAIGLLRQAETQIAKRVAPPAGRDAVAPTAPAVRERLLALQGYVGVVASQPFGPLGDARYGEYVGRIRDGLVEALRLIGVETGADAAVP